MRTIFAIALLLFAGLVLGQVLPSNVSYQLAASAVQTAAEVDATAPNNNQTTSVQVIINVSAFTSGQYVPHIQGRDPFTGNWYDILVGSAITGTGQTVLKVGRGLLPVPNASAADVLPQTWRVQMIGTSTPSMTFSITANLGI